MNIGLQIDTFLEDAALKNFCFCIFYFSGHVTYYVGYSTATQHLNYIYKNYTTKSNSSEI